MFEAVDTTTPKGKTTALAELSKAGATSITEEDLQEMPVTGALSVQFRHHFLIRTTERWTIIGSLPIWLIDEIQAARYSTPTRFEKVGVSTTLEDMFRKFVGVALGDGSKPTTTSVSQPTTSAFLE